MAPLACSEKCILYKSSSIHWLIPLLLLFGWFVPKFAAAEIYEAPEAFLAKVFDGGVPQPSTLWLNAEQKQQIRALLGHDLAALRIRYWGHDQRTAWILEEIGKERPITTGIVVNNGEIERVQVLIFRESRGWEVRYPFFTEQFQGLELTGSGELSGRIDGISGATLSVSAVSRLAKVALYLHSQSEFADTDASS